MAFVEGPDGISSLPDVLLAKQSDLWGHLWQHGHTCSKIEWPSHSFQCTTGEAIVQGASSFKCKTSVVDGWHPAGFGFLSSRALEHLAFIFSVFEQLGDFDPKQRSLLTRLLVKPDSGRRPINLFRAMYRTRSSTQRDLVRF